MSGGFSSVKYFSISMSDPYGMLLLINGKEKFHRKVEQLISRPTRLVLMLEILSEKYKIKRAYLLISYVVIILIGVPNSGTFGVVTSIIVS